MKRHRRWFVWFLLLAASLSVPLHGQEEEKLPTEDPPPWGDLVSNEDPSLRQDEPQLGEPLAEYEGSEAFLDLPKSDDELGKDPADIRAAAWTVPLTCQSYPASSPQVKPIRMAQANARYFSYDGIPLILVGASADNGCVFRLVETDQCNLGNYPATFALNQNPGTNTPVNKVRIWIGMGFGYGGAQQAPNSPFLWVTPPAGPKYWLLDAKGAAGTDYAAFFERLRAVVNEARRRNLFVEVTLFSPWQGAAFNLGPWSKAGGLAKAAEPPGSASLFQAGFSSAYYQVVKDSSSSDAALNEKMRAYQANVVKWTVDTLWCFDNVIWEIANEPEAQGPEEQGQRKAVDTDAAARWQRAMIYEVRKAEKAYSPRLAYGHLIAAQPFSKAGANSLFSAATAPPTPGWQPDPNFPLDVQVLNGHYTTVLARDIPTFGSSIPHVLDAGAIDLIRDGGLNKKKIPFGFNETNITNLLGKRGTKHHLNRAVVQGGPEPARAEAWEFLFSGGTAYDHFGYLGLGATPNATAKAIRIQLGRLLDLYGKRRFNLPAPTPKLTDFGTAKISDFINSGVGTYKSWECRTSSQRYWAALTATASSYRALLLYLHHSTPRCDNDNLDYDHCDSVFPPFGSYDARVWTTSPPTPPQGCTFNEPAGQPGYRESFKLKPGTYDVSWIDPETVLPFPGSPAAQTITCLAECTVSSPVYKFDILLKLVKR